MDPTATGAWSVSASHYPRHGSVEEQLMFCLRYAILAPSAQNAQPWRFRVAGGKVEVFADPTRSLPVMDPNQRQLAIGCGAAICNLHIALKRFGFEGELTLLPRPDCLAEIAPGKHLAPTEEVLELFDAIKIRRTNREPFSERPVSFEIADKWRDAAKAHGVRFVRLLPEQKQRAAELIAEGDRLQLSDKDFRTELAKWTAVSEDRPDGIPVHKKGFGEVSKRAAPLIIRTFDRGDKVAAQEQELATHSPVLAVFATDEDRPESWLNCGIALERVLLIAASHGISASYLNQPLELAVLRPMFAEIIGDELYPQLIVRLGFGPGVEPTPRRGLEDTLL